MRPSLREQKPFVSGFFPAFAVPVYDTTLFQNAPLGIEGLFGHLGLAVYDAQLHNRDNQ
jgi:hypothetical protein